MEIPYFSTISDENGELNYGGYYTSSDLKCYDRGVFLTPTIEEETHGVYIQVCQ